MLIGRNLHLSNMEFTKHSPKISGFMTGQPEKGKPYGIISINGSTFNICDLLFFLGNDVYVDLPDNSPIRIGDLFTIRTSSDHCCPR